MNINDINNPRVEFITNNNIKPIIVIDGEFKIQQSRTDSIKWFYYYLDKYEIRMGTYYVNPYEIGDFIDYLISEIDKYGSISNTEVNSGFTILARGKKIKKIMTNIKYNG